jgi:hypothetical protein
VAAVLLLVLPGSSRAGFKIGITDSRQQPASVVAALGESIQRYDVVWTGESTFSGTIEFTPGLRQVVAVYGTAKDVPTSDAERAAYASFVRSLLTRYPQVRDVVVWNEPYKANTYFWGDHDYSLYADLLATVAPVIRQLGARVLGPGLHPMGPDQAAPLIAAIAARDPHLLDIWTMHAYEVEQLEAQVISRVRAILGWAIPVWVTEDGIDTLPPISVSGLYRFSGPDPWLTPANWFNESQQAQVIPWMIQHAYCAGADAWMNFQLWDENDLSRWQSGLLRPDGSVKPAFSTAVSASAAARSGNVDCSNPTAPAPVSGALASQRSEPWNGGYRADHVRPRVEPLKPQ